MANEGSGKRWRWIAWMAGLVVLAGLVRAPRLYESLWYDEIAAWRDYGALANRPPDDAPPGAARRGPLAIVTTYHDPANHVGHTLASWFAVEWLGGIVGEELALRLPAFLVSLASVVVIAGLGRATAGERVGLLAGAAAALAPVSVLSGVEARGYSMMIAASAGATWAAIVLLDPASSRRRGATVAYAIVTALGVWAHLMTLFVPIGHTAWVAWRATKHHTLATLGRFGPALLGAAAVTLLLYAPIIVAIVRVARRFARVDDGPSIFGPEGAHALLQLGGAWSLWAVPALVLFVIGFATGLAPKTATRRTRVLIGLGHLGLAVQLAAVLITGSWSYARFSLYALPAACVCMALGADVVARRHRGLGIGLALAVLLAWGLDLAWRPPKQPIRDALVRVAETRAPDETVLVIGLRHEVADVYAQRLGLTTSYSPQHGADLEQRLAEEPAWIVVLYPDYVSRERRELLDTRGYETVARYDGWADWGHGDVEVLHRRTR